MALLDAATCEKGTTPYWGSTASDAFRFRSASLTRWVNKAGTTLPIVSGPRVTPVRKTGDCAALLGQANAPQQIGKARIASQRVESGIHPDSG